MPLRDGDQIGPYAILGPLGKGGMGEVYRARDTRLDRLVALKLLAEGAAQDADHLSRFERETRAVAALNHPNILAIHDTGSHRGVPYAVTELLEGETLAERLHSGPIAPKKAVDIACQIADGLAAAHARGVIHRDIKPENIFLTHEGRAKILDFGIARMERPTQPFGVRTGGRTRGTSAKFVVGTAGYMSPEQVRGKPIDSRTDVFSLGATFFEMLTGKQAFARDSAVETFGAVLKDDPGKNPEAEKIPPEIRRFVYRCLEKDAADRYQSARDLLIDLRSFQAEGIQESAKRVQFRSEPPWKHRRTRVAVRAVAAVVIFGLGLLLGRLWLRQERSAKLSDHPVARAVLALEPPPTLTVWQRNNFALSPDGTRLVYSAAPDGPVQLFLHKLDTLETIPLPGTENGDGPFFSPDGQWVGFFSGPYMKKLALAGGVPVTVTRMSPVTRGAAWGPDDSILFSFSLDTGLSRVAASGEVTMNVTRPLLEKGERAHRWPEFLPGGESILFTIQKRGDPDEGDIVAQRLDGGERKLLVRGGSYARYAPSGHLVFSRKGTILAAPFNLETLEVTGPIIPIVTGVRTEETGAAQFAFSRHGTLVYMPDRPSAARQNTPVWVSRRGDVEPLLGSQRDVFVPRFSPDGDKLACWIGLDNSDIYVVDWKRGTTSRLTPEETSEFGPVWFPDGSRIAYASARKGEPPGIYWRNADGTGEEQLLWKGDRPRFPHSFSPDGRALAYFEAALGEVDIWVLLLEEPPRAVPFRKTGAIEADPVFSPDGRWIAYTSNKTGRFEVYVSPYPGPGGEIPISGQGGLDPAWSRDGRELFYRSGDKFFAARVESGPSPAIGTPQLLFERAGLYSEGGLGFRQYDVSPDGRFLMVERRDDPSAPASLQLVTEWFSELEKRAPNP